MTVDQILTRARARLDDDGSDYSPDDTHQYYSAATLLRALNEGERLFALLTLCLEKTVNLALTADQANYNLLSQTGFSDFLVPLRVRVVSGARLIASRISQLDALNTDWQATGGTPDRYSLNGFDFLSLNKQPTGAGTSLAITYAYSPPKLRSGDTPAIPPEYHTDLVDYTVHGARVSEGGKDFLDTVPLLQRFLANAQKQNEYIRLRSKAQRYDTLPAELGKVDLSRLLEKLARRGRAPLLERAS